MTTKEHLKQYRTLCGQVERYKERIEQIEASLNKSLELDGMPHGTSTGNPTQETAIQLAMIRTKLQTALIEAEYMRQTIAEEIEEMETSTYKELLYSRYILLLTWEDVTNRVSIGRRERYDLKHVMGYMHGQALREFEERRNDSIKNDPLHEKG